MLPEANRLKKKKDFEQVFKKGEGFKEDFLFLKKVKNNLNQDRFGFIVSRKISKKAILRNKIKRRIRELVKIKILGINEECRQPLTRAGMDVVLIALPGLETRDFWEIEEMISNLFQKAGICALLSGNRAFIKQKYAKKYDWSKIRNGKIFDS